MCPKLILFSLLLLLLCTGISGTPSDFVDGVELTTIRAPWTLRILGNDLDITNVRVKTDQQSAYFMMISRSSELNVSVFIEPVNKCKTSDECRDYVLGFGNPAWGRIENLTKGTMKDFSYFEFYRPSVNSQPLRIQDMYAEYVGQDYWVDLHISKALFEKEDRRLFENVVKSVSFILKNNSSPGGFGPQNAQAQSSTKAWLGLWDKKKCNESYNELSSITRADITEKVWVDYCARVNAESGSMRSRTLIAAAFTKSFPPKTDRPVAVLAYQSSFANRPSVVELVALLLPKDQSWIVTNYYLPE